MNYDNVWEDFDCEIKRLETPKKTKGKCCDNFYMIEMEGCIVCVECGVVCKVGIIDDTPDFCEFAESSHTKTSIFYPKSSGCTSISGNSSMSRIQNWNSMPYDERVLWEVSNVLKSKLRNNFQPRIIDDSIANFKTLDNKKGEDGKKEIHRGRIRDGLIASCVYFACKTNYINKTPEEIAAIMDVNISTFNKCTKIYTRIMGQSQETISSVDFVDTYCNSIADGKISFKVQNTIRKICNAVENIGILDGTIPQNITAGCIFFVSVEMNLDLSSKFLSMCFSISLNTLIKVFNKINTNKSSIYKYIVENKK